MKIILPIKENPEKILKDIKNQIALRGGDFSGNLQNGKFTILGIKGEYKILEDQLEIIIISKPFLIPDSFIKNEIEKYFKSI